MNKRCIVNVATGEFYCKMQKRLIDSFIPSVDAIHLVRGVNENGTFIGDVVRRYGSPFKGIDLIAFNDCLPPGSRPHSESPYGFKVHAIKKAYEMGYTSILWLDSPAYAVKEDISPIFDKIEKEGYYAMSHIDPLEKYVSNVALSKFRFIDREDLIGHNLPSGSCYGFDIKSTFGEMIFRRLCEFERDGHFNYPPPHRHDETILALIMLAYSMPVFTFDPLFQSDSTECVIKSGGE